MPNGHKNSRLTRSQAIKLVAEAERPESIPGALWPQIQVMLLTIARHYPNSWPSEVTLSRAVHRSVPTVKRYIKIAVDAGLLVRYQRLVWQGRYGSNQYHLRYHHRGSSVILGPGITHDPLTSTDTYVSVPRTEALYESFLKRPNSGAPSGAGRNNMSDTSDLGPGIGDDSSELQASVERHPSRPRSPASRVTQHFELAWYEYVTSPPGKSHAMEVLFDSKAAFQTRVKTDLIERDRRTVADICASFDVFLHDLGARLVSPRPGQPVWKVWWSRRATYLTRVAPVPHSAVAPPQEPLWRQRMRAVDESSE
jgi:hypothetical protein